MGALKGWHIVVLLVVVLLLFGAPKLPELARSIGKSLHILKDEAKSLTNEDDEPSGASQANQNTTNSASSTTPPTSAQTTNDAANTSTTEVHPNSTSHNGDTEARGK
ncbi:Sec-independent protein translocase subunit TatA [Demequina aurantiaca]|uniref:Sec-independent protein translocase subunit TatA n=1 Tax=Demequina aurantiaca TaxID=676200 RepID=UPI000A03DD90|nr:Sec-independent protein translocase subunit TatA [Demequina aurantiaca]